MKRMRLAGLLVLAAVMLAGAGPSGSGPSAGAGLPEWEEPAQYRVDMVVKRGGETIVLRRFIDSGRVRSEIRAEGRDMVMIERRDRNAVYMIPPVMPGEKRVYIERKLPKVEKAEKAGAGLPPGLSVRRLGSETVGGRPCVKYELTYQGRTAVFWADQETGAPVRIRDPEISMDWQDYRIGPQPAALFEPPPGYRRQVMPDLAQLQGLMDGQFGAGMAARMGGQAALGMAGTMASRAAGQALAGAGMALGGPVGAMVGQYVGERVADCARAR